MQLHVDPHTGTPVYRQIERQIAEAIADRRLRPGDPLLSEAELAARLVVSPRSVRKAYEQLESGGLCRVGDGRQRRVVAGEAAPPADVRAGRALALLERELLAEELDSARRLQRRLLPAARCERGPWVAEARTRTASTLSGDFYDWIELPGGDLGVVVADVAGKGLAAGLLMAVARSMLPFLAPGLAADEVLRKLNRRLCPLLGKRQFVALAYARLSATGGGFELANAGLPDPYLLGPAGLAPVATPGPHLPLGLRPDVPYVASRRSWRAGDRLLFTTDGIAEARGACGDPLGYERLAELVRRTSTAAPAAGAAEWLDDFAARVHAITGPLPEDDWTVLLVEDRSPRA